MTLDLFALEPVLERLTLEDADIRFVRKVELAAPPEALLAELVRDTPWRHEAVTVYGQRHLQPRLTAWYGDPGAHYAYAGLALAPLAWTPTLSRLRRCVEDLVGHPFNSVLLNHYRDHRDRMGLHSDDEPELGPAPVIASLSLGATRTFVLKHKTRRALKPVRLALPSGSLLLMQGRTQLHWRHGIECQAQPCGPRLNLTFRCVAPKA